MSAFPKERIDLERVEANRDCGEGYRTNQGDQAGPSAGQAIRRVADAAAPAPASDRRDTRDENEGSGAETGSPGGSPYRGGGRWVRRMAVLKMLGGDFSDGAD
jgi:hypothetical protein